jgi:hypothetical protein
MNEIPKSNSANTAAANQQNATETNGVRQQQPRTASAVSDIGTLAARRGVHFSLNNDSLLTEKIRTYVPGQPTTPESIAEGDKDGTFLAKGRNVLRELLGNITPTSPAIETTGSFTAQRVQSRWESTLTRPQPRPTTETPINLPVRTVDRPNTAPDTAIRMPTRRADADDEI